MKYLMGLLTMIILGGNLFSQELEIKKEVVRTDNAIVCDFNNFGLNSSLGIGYKRWVSSSIVLKGVINCGLLSSTEKSHGDATEATRNQSGLSVFIEKHLRTYKKISIYLFSGVGAGYIKDSYDNANAIEEKSIEKRYSVSAEAGLGFECFLLDNISFSAQFSAFSSYSKYKQENYLEWQNVDRTEKRFGNKISPLILSIYF